jgi:hypothetical protein
MIDVYFPIKKPGEAVGGISLKEVDHKLKVNIWRTYKVFFITENTVLFKKMDNEFCTINGKYNHEMGQVIVRVIDNEWLNVNVKE